MDAVFIWMMKIAPAEGRVLGTGRTTKQNWIGRFYYQETKLRYLTTLHPRFRNASIEDVPSSEMGNYLVYKRLHAWFATPWLPVAMGTEQFTDEQRVYLVDKFSASAFRKLVNP